VLQRSTQRTTLLTRQRQFSVSDLVGPAYCEVKTLYNIIGLSCVPLDAQQRAQLITPG
jgi:hypothetical protein